MSSDAIALLVSVLVGVSVASLITWLVSVDTRACEQSYLPPRVPTKAELERDAVMLDDGVRLYCFYCGSTDPFDHICDPDPKKFVRGHTRWLQPPIFAEIRHCQVCGCQLDMCSDTCLNCGNIE